MGGKFSIFVLNLNKYEKVGEAKLIECAGTKKTFTIKKEIIQLKKELNEISLELIKISSKFSKISEEKSKIYSELSKNSSEEILKIKLLSDTQYIKVNNEYNKILDERIKVNNEYIKTLNLLLELIIDDKEYIKGLISYLENVKIKCPSKYEKYEEVLFDVYFGTDPIFAKRKFNKKIQNDLVNINFHKLTDIIIKKLDISKIKKDNAMKDYKKKLSNLTTNLTKLFTKKLDSNKAVAKKPVTKKPVTKKPVTKKPITKKPVTKKPVTKKPVTKKSITK